MEKIKDGCPTSQFSHDLDIWTFSCSIAIHFGRLLLKLFVSQGLMQVETGASRKALTWSKDNKDGNKIKLEQIFMVITPPQINAV